MSSAFDVFDNSGAMAKKVITAGYHNSSGVWVPPSESSATFSGHISSVSDKRLQFLPEAVRELGTRILSVDGSVVLKNGDRIQVTEPDGSTTMWTIGEEAKTTSLMKSIGVNRRRFYISLTKNV